MKLDLSLHQIYDAWFHHHSSDQEIHFYGSLGIAVENKCSLAFILARHKAMC
jgi:hypothetical protein